MIPNILTTFRLIIIPFFAIAIFRDDVWLAVWLFVLSGATDIIDGWIARHFNMITSVGKVYDPLVDKLMQITAVVCLAAKGYVPLWVLVVVFLKEFAMIVAGIILYTRKIVVFSNWYGKFATIFFYTVILLFIIFNDVMPDWCEILLSVALTAVVVWAALAYLMKFINKKEGDICDKRT